MEGEKSHQSFLCLKRKAAELPDFQKVQLLCTLTSLTPVCIPSPYPHHGPPLGMQWSHSLSPAQTADSQVFMTQGDTALEINSLPLLL